MSKKKQVEEEHSRDPVVLSAQMAEIAAKYPDIVIRHGDDGLVGEEFLAFQRYFALQSWLNGLTKNIDEKN
jgi:hypothetical protein